MDIELREIQAGTLFEDNDFSITAFPVIHRGDGVFGFAFEEKSRRPFLPEKAEALGDRRLARSGKEDQVASRDDQQRHRVRARHGR